MLKEFLVQFAFRMGGGQGGWQAVCEEGGAKYSMQWRKSTKLENARTSHRAFRGLRAQSHENVRKESFGAFRPRAAIKSKRSQNGHEKVRKETRPLSWPPRRPKSPERVKKSQKGAKTASF